MTKSLLDELPPELIEAVLSYADIPSLGSLAETSKSNLFCQVASGNVTWANLVERRFRIVTSKTVPKFYGRHCWKRAYSSMAKSDRIPRSRYTSSRKIVFAKGKANQRTPNDCVSLWVLMGHTENCKTRTAQRQHEESSMARATSHDQPLGDNERFVELNLCIQNVKSGAGAVVVDVVEAALELMGSPESCRPLTSGSSRPKVLFHDAKETDDEACASFDVTNGIKLRPFEFAIVSVHFPCSAEVYETDFLARAVSLHVPVRRAMDGRCSRVSDCAALFLGRERTARGLALSQSATSHASAFFIPEKEVWKYYEALPGGCLTLVDRFRMVPL